MWWLGPVALLGASVAGYLAEQVAESHRKSRQEGATAALQTLRQIVDEVGTAWKVFYLVFIIIVIGANIGLTLLKIPRDGSIYILTRWIICGLPFVFTQWMHAYVDGRLPSALAEISSPDLMPMMRTLTLSGGFSGVAIWKKLEEIKSLNVHEILRFLNLEEILKMFGIT